MIVCGCVRALQEVDALYATALNHFPDNAILHVFVAQYLNVYRANRHLELVHIAAAEVRPSSCCGRVPCPARYARARTHHSEQTPGH